MTANADTSPVWFVTGCSSGFGKALVERVLKHGHRCVATARDPAKLATLVAAYPRTGLALALDVTKAEQRANALDQARKRFGDIDVLVNNAGHGYSAAIEEGEESEIRRMFETNFFALAAMTRLVLPGMRARGRGHIVNISSIGGMVGNPASGYYCATKFAVEGMSQALAKEVAPLGIRVTLIEPGPFRTDFQGRSMTTVAQPIDAYAATAGERRAQLRESSGKQPGDPVRAADAIIKVVESTDPPLHLVLGKVGVKRVRDALREVLDGMDAWEQVSLGADFPQR